MIDNKEENKNEEPIVKTNRKNRAEKLVSPMLSSSEMIFNGLSYNDHKISHPH